MYLVHTWMVLVHEDWAKNWRSAASVCTSTSQHHFNSFVIVLTFVSTCKVLYQFVLAYEIHYEKLAKNNIDLLKYNPN